MPGADDMQKIPAVTGRDAAALLSWWVEAGADTLVADTPVSWLEAPDMPEPVPAPEVVARKPAIAPDHQPDLRDEFASFETLEALTAHVARMWPGTPFADGNPESGFMILGEGPSAEDLRQGHPFTGPAGLLLDRMLRAIGRDRTSAYISLIAPRRRIPGPVPEDAITADLALTRAHIRLAAPRVLLLLGGPAVKAFTGNKSPISRLRGQWLPLIHPELSSIPALASFNPAYLLRKPVAKAESWADLLEIKSRLS